MKTYRILFTGVGRRVELLQAFRQAAHCLNVNLKIYGADMTGTAPALFFCDYVRKVCGMRDPKYIPQLLEICKKDCIDLIIPTIDTDLLVLSQHKDEFEQIGIKVLISNSDKIAICRDKNYTADFFEVCGVKAPRTVNDYQIYEGEYPCFIKPKDGSSSINAFKAENEAELQLYAEQIKEYVIQPFVEGTEYTVDIFCDFDGKPIFITPRIRIAVRAGEVLKTEISMDEKIIDECKKIINEFQPVGPITIQLIRSKKTGEDYFIEINPRFGGGAPLSMKAGASSAEIILKMLSDKEYADESSIADGAIYSRYDQSVCISNEKNRQPILGYIFDLDDTLYSEKQYVKSGYKAVAQFLGNETFAERMWNYFENGKKPIDELLEELGCNEKKTACLEIYRSHIPEITLYEGVMETIEQLKKDGNKVGIITDGRSMGQRKKIRALGLENKVDDIIITDELGGEQFRKPCDISFRIMQRRWRIPFENIVYVGDNINKDFMAPKQLGMQSIYMRNKDGLYYENERIDIVTVSSITDLIK